MSLKVSHCHCMVQYTFPVLCNALLMIIQYFCDSSLRCNCRVLLAAVSPVLGTLLYTCFLHGTRQLAYRTARFLRLCLRFVGYCVCEVCGVLCVRCGVLCV